MSEKLTTAQVAERLDVSHPTVKLWCRQGRFPNALLEEETRGPVWRIPESDLKGFIPPVMGRPPKAKPAQSNDKKRGKGR
jgi:excisionase family DNA binding protein